jgi:hypothetical protein
MSRVRYPLTTWCSIQDALSLFMLPLKSDEARTDFYTVYNRESIEYDTNYVKKYEEDLNTTLVFVSPTTNLSLEM